MEATERILLGLAGVLLLGISAQWLAWKLRLPSILLLLVFGFAVGNLLSPEWSPDALLGDLLFPVVSLSVAVILFEGGLTLRLGELKHVGATVLRLVTIGVLVTAVVAMLLARYVVGLDWELAFLVGSILTVTGPTVVGPLLRYVRPAGRVGPILNWEGILVDPVGAVLAVLVFEAIRAGLVEGATGTILLGVVETLAVGLIVGAAASVFMVLAFRKHVVPDHLQNPFALALVLGATVLSNQLHHEAGLLTATLMGFALSNQRWFPVRHIVEFKENLRVLLISSLFILLAARVSVADLQLLSFGSVLFVLGLILVARPLTVAASTVTSSLTWKEKAFVAWMAPRGIVAAAVTSIFALRLEEEGILVEGARQLVPLVFLVIVGTVSLYGLTAAPFARRLGLAEKEPQGVLLLGCHPFSIALGKLLHEEGVPVLMVDNNYRKVSSARMEGLPVWHGNILAEYAIEEMRLGGIGKLFAMTPNDEANSLATQHMREVFSRTDLYQLVSDAPREGMREAALAHELRGRLLFGEGRTYRDLNDRVARGWVLKTTPLTEKFDFDSFREQHGDDAIPLLLLYSGRVTPLTVLDPKSPREGSVLVHLAPPTCAAPAVDVTKEKEKEKEKGDDEKGESRSADGPAAT